MRGIEERLGDLSWVLELDRPLEHAARIDVLRRVADRLATTAVREGAELGPASTRQVASPAWSAPEQIEPGHPADSRTDVWAIGLVALRSITGRAFWRSDATDFHALAVEVTSTPLPSASERHAELGQESWAGALDEWFARCVCHDRAARFADPALAVAHLARVVPSASEDAGSAARGAERAAAPPVPTERPRSAALLFALGLLLALGAAVVMFAIGFGMGARTRPPATAATRETPSPPLGPPMEPLHPRAAPVAEAATRESETVARTPAEVLDPWAAPAPTPAPAAPRQRGARRGHRDFVDPWADP